jgi:TRAP-type C4-dicarboxylate transport system permease small subunit
LQLFGTVLTIACMAITLSRTWNASLVKLRRKFGLLWISDGAVWMMKILLFALLFGGRLPTLVYIANTLNSDWRESPQNEPSEWEQSTISNSITLKVLPLANFRPLTHYLTTFLALIYSQTVPWR